MKVVTLRELKNRLAGYVRKVQAGEVILISDRGQVVAELRRPLRDAPQIGPPGPALERLAREGKIRIGLPNAEEAYRACPGHVADGVIERLIDEDRAGS